MILDTCAVLWLAFDRPRLSAATLERIEQSDRILISTLSIWEIGVKVRKGRLAIPVAVDELVGAYARNGAVTFVAPDVDIVQRALALGWEHKDPVDTMIVATAQKHSACIVTADALIRSFYSNTCC